MTRLRKRILNDDDVVAAPSQPEEGWLEVATLASVEVTSEAEDAPIENALVLNAPRGGWHAARPGVQVVRLLFDVPCAIERIQLELEELLAERTQEIVIAWSPVDECELREVVRQRWNFSPHGSTLEREDYAVKLRAVKVLQLTIDPDVARADAFASLRALRLR